MDLEAAKRFRVVVAGFGSPHGDDQVGWKVISELSQRPHLPARVVRIREGTQLIHELDGCEKLIVVDACRGSGPRGTISRYWWPDPRITLHHDRSTHEIGVCSALALAQQLGKLPGIVHVYGIEIGEGDLVGNISGELLRAIDELVAVIVAEIGEVVYA